MIGQLGPALLQRQQAIAEAHLRAGVQIGGAVAHEQVAHADRQVRAVDAGQRAAVALQAVDHRQRRALPQRHRQRIEADDAALRRKPQPALRVEPGGGLHAAVALQFGKAVGQAEHQRRQAWARAGEMFEQVGTADAEDALVAVHPQVPLRVLAHRVRAVRRQSFGPPQADRAGAVRIVGGHPHQAAAFGADPQRAVAGPVQIPHRGVRQQRGGHRLHGVAPHAPDAAGAAEPDLAALGQGQRIHAQALRGLRPQALPRVALLPPGAGGRAQQQAARIVEADRQHLLAEQFVRQRHRLEAHRARGAAPQSGRVGAGVDAAVRRRRHQPGIVAGQAFGAAVRMHAPVAVDGAQSSPQAAQPHRAVAVARDAVDVAAVQTDRLVQQLHACAIEPMDAVAQGHDPDRSVVAEQQVENRSAAAQHRRRERAAVRPVLEAPEIAVAGDPHGAVRGAPAAVAGTRQPLAGGEDPPRSAGVGEIEPVRGADPHPVGVTAQLRQVPRSVVVLPMRDAAGIRHAQQPSLRRAPQRAVGIHQRQMRRLHAVARRRLPQPLPGAGAIGPHLAGHRDHPRRVAARRQRQRRFRTGRESHAHGKRPRRVGAVQGLPGGQAQAVRVDVAHRLRPRRAQVGALDAAGTHGQPVAVRGVGEQAPARVGVQRLHAIAGHRRKAHRIVHVEAPAVETRQAVVRGQPEESVDVDARGAGAVDRQPVDRPVVLLHPARLRDRRLRQAGGEHPAERQPSGEGRKPGQPHRGGAVRSGGKRQQ